MRRAQLARGRELQPGVVVLAEDDVVLVACVGLVAGLRAVLAQLEPVGGGAARLRGRTQVSPIERLQNPAALPCSHRPRRQDGRGGAIDRGIGPVDLEVRVVGDVEAGRRLAVEVAAEVGHPVPGVGLHRHGTGLECVAVPARRPFVGQDVLDVGLEGNRLDLDRRRRCAHEHLDGGRRGCLRRIPGAGGLQRRLAGHAGQLAVAGHRGSGVRAQTAGASDGRRCRIPRSSDCNPDGAGRHQRHARQNDGTTVGDRSAMTHLVPFVSQAPSRLRRGAAGSGQYRRRRRRGRSRARRLSSCAT